MSDQSHMRGQLRGAAPVGHLDDLDPVEVGAVLYFRLWCAGPGARQQIAHELDLALGTHAGAAAFRSLDALCELCAHNARRPLVHHDVGCDCLGADESCFANVISAASVGAREDAMLMATLMVRPDLAPSLVGLAQTLGLALRRVALRAGAVGDLAPNSAPHPTTYH